MNTAENSTAESTEAAEVPVEPIADRAARFGTDAETADSDQESPATSDTPSAAGGGATDEAAEPAFEPAGGIEGDADASETAAAPPVERREPVTDEVLLASVDIAREALLEVTPEDTIGDPVGHVAEDDHVLSLFFDSKLRGYPGWHWTVTLARVGDDGAPTVLETELMPGEHALVAPDWVPWSERLADYQATQELAESEAKALAAALLDDTDDDEDEDEFSILHAGDVDGVDVDEIDDSDEDDSDDDDSDDDDSHDDDSDDDDSDDDELDDDDSDEDDEYDDSDDEAEDDGPDRSY